jgi:hypothetical protein
MNAMALNLYHVALDLNYANENATVASSKVSDEEQKRKKWDCDFGNGKHSKTTCFERPWTQAEIENCCCVRYAIGAVVENQAVGLQTVRRMDCPHEL